MADSSLIGTGRLKISPCQMGFSLFAGSNAPACHGIALQKCCGSGLGKVPVCFVFLQGSEALQIRGQKWRLDCKNNVTIMYLSMYFGVWFSDPPDTEIVRFLFPIFSLLAQLLCTCWKKKNNTSLGICFLITPRAQISHRHFIETCGHSLSSSKSPPPKKNVLPLYICLLYMLLKFYSILFVYICECVCV